MDDNKKFWESVAKFYTPLQEKSNRELYQQVIERCRKHLNVEDEVLELACGTGQFSLELAPLVKSWEATDFSHKMIEEFSSRIESNPLSGLSLSVQDATHLDAASKSFDVVFMANALHVMPEPEKALGEISRVLKPQGKLIVPTFVYDGKLNHFRLWFLEKMGFKTFHQWRLKDLEAFLIEKGFILLESERIPGKLLPEGFVVCQKKSS